MFVNLHYFLALTCTISPKQIKLFFAQKGAVLEPTP